MAGRSGIMGGVAKVLNAGGSAVVTAYDISSSALGNALTSVKKTATVLPEEIKQVVEGRIGAVLPGEKGKLEGKIKDYEKKVQGLYLEIGKESTKFSDKGMALDSETVKRLLAEIRGYMTEIDSLKRRIAEIEAEKLTREEKRRESKEKPQAIAESDVLQAVREAIDDVLSRGRTMDYAAQAAFEKVARCLVGDDHGLRSLAVKEMGHMKNRAAVLILTQAAAFKDPELTVDILNALAAIGDTSVIPLFEGKAGNEDPLVRKSALHGLYKLSAENTTAHLVEALEDVSADVRVAAATMLGWMEAKESMSSLSARLEDRDPRVRKATIAALADFNDKTMIRPIIRMLADDKVDVRARALEALRLLMGQNVEFDINASGKALTEAVEALQDWWWNKTVAGIEAPAPWEIPAKVTTEALAVEAAVETAPVTETAPEVPATAEETPAEEATAEICATTEEADTPQVEETVETQVSGDEAREARIDELNKMRKYDLLRICNEQGIVCDVTLTKAEIINLLLERTDA